MATLQYDIVNFMDDNFSCKRTNQLRKAVIPIVFNMCACSDGILPSNSDFLFAKTLGWGKWIPAPRFRGDKFTPAKAGAGMTMWCKN